LPFAQAFRHSSLVWDTVFLSAEAFVPPVIVASALGRQEEPVWAVSPPVVLPPCWRGLCFAVFEKVTAEVVQLLCAWWKPGFGLQENGQTFPKHVWSLACKGCVVLQQVFFVLSVFRGS